MALTEWLERLERDILVSAHNNKRQKEHTNVNEYCQRVCDCIDVFTNRLGLCERENQETAYGIAL